VGGSHQLNRSGSTPEPRTGPTGAGEPRHWLTAAPKPGGTNKVVPLVTQVCPFRASGGRMPKRSEPLMAKSTWFQGVTALRYLRMEMRRFVSSVLKPTGMEKMSWILGGCPCLRDL